MIGNACPECADVIKSPTTSGEPVADELPDDHPGEGNDG